MLLAWNYQNSNAGKQTLNTIRNFLLSLFRTTEYLLSKYSSLILLACVRLIFVESLVNTKKIEIFSSKWNGCTGYECGHRSLGTIPECIVWWQITLVGVSTANRTIAEFSIDGKSRRKQFIGPKGRRRCFGRRFRWTHGSTCTWSGTFEGIQRKQSLQIQSTKRPKYLWIFRFLL